MKPKTLKKSPDEDRSKSKKMRSSVDKRHRRRRRSSLSYSDSDSPARKRSKKLPERPPSSKKKLADKKGKKKSSSRRRRHRTPSPSPSGSSSLVSRSYSSRSCSTCSSSSSVSERSLSPPRRSRSTDTKKGKERGRGRDRGRKRDWKRTMRRSRGYSSSSDGGDSRYHSRSRSKSRKGGTRPRVDDSRDEARDKIIQAYDDFPPLQRAKNGIEDVDKDNEERARDAAMVAMIKKGRSDIVEYEKNAGSEKADSPPAKSANEKGEILPCVEHSPEAEDLELILRQKALENFRKLRGAAVSAVKIANADRGLEMVLDRPQDNANKITEQKSLGSPLQTQGTSLGVSPLTGSVRSLESDNDRSSFRRHGSAPSMNRVTGLPRLPEIRKDSSPLHREESSVGVSHPTAQPGLVEARSSSSVMQRLGSSLGSTSSVRQRLGTSPEASLMNGPPRIRSVISIPTREEHDDGTMIRTLSASENSFPVHEGSEVRPGTNEPNKVQRTNEGNEKTTELSTSGACVLSGTKDRNEAVPEDKDGSQYEQKTFSRMHDGESVQVSYKVYIPKKSPALARKQLQK